MKLRRLVPAILWVILISSLLQPASAAAETCSPGCPVYLPIVNVANPIPPVQVVETDTVGQRGVGVVLQGNLEATAGVPVYDVILEVRWYREDGLLVAVTQGRTKFDATLPGHLNYFTSYSYEENFSRAEVKVKGWSFKSDRIYVPLTVLDTQIEQIGSLHQPIDFKVDTRFRNDQSKPVTNVKALVWTVGQGYGSTTDDIADRLLPGETVPYSRYLQYVHPDPSRVHVEAQGILQP